MSFIKSLLPKVFISLLILTTSIQSVVLANPLVETETEKQTNIENVLTNSAAEINSKTIIHVFERQECKHCQDLKLFLYKQDTSNLQIIFYDINLPQEQQNFQRLSQKLNISQSTPFTIIGDTYIQGFESEQTTGKQIIQILQTTKNSYPTVNDLLQANLKDSFISAFTCSEDNDDETCSTEYKPYFVKIPLIGNIDIKQYTLASMSLILGFIDGFNPCAMWVLVTFLLILMQIGDRKKMLQIAGLFILAETIMYYLILNLWLTTWNFVGLNNYVTPIVGTIAIGGGLFFLYEWKTNDGTCKVTNSKQKSATTSKIKAIAQNPLTITTAIATIGLALSVNIIEFACSIGIPQTFTKILDLNPLTSLQKQFYMLLYIIMYMIDDFIVFGLALYSIDKIGLATKYSKWCNLIGGILMLILGLILITKPSLLIL